MLTMSEKNASGTKSAPRLVVAILTAVTTILCLGLIFLFALLAAKTPGSSADRSIVGVILSLIGSFAVFFAVISIQGTTFLFKARLELLSLAGWRLLAATLILLGLACALSFHWIALVLPTTVALICLLRDPKVQAWLRFLGI
jgi:hypothetical protein